ncbi:MULTISPECIES: MFS transporter [Micromonospora]|uniref:MFS transporter n=1 Tax=Micromonospora solifontis TaxID=2487138 RepID=A0ABX9WGK3_9ACTN|nr:MULTISPECIES: MFS transporter [Micromonospora]NES15147.1 MFS transporter [Micromonospora sp. PPF5-17B]NES36846.1 MFS transporter [Micromonospora solifontis]NES56482.1 MFS transporter [Micromonospora sp. PPF5-6]RNL99035.1 MFS transporter [Micromonospora solifontis]
MNLKPYREALALPGLRSLLLVSVLARVPLTATGVTLTFHVVLDLGRGYGAAGLVGAASTVGAALGSPLLGRLVDRRGLRPVLLLTTLAEGVFWAVAPTLSYPVLLPAAFLAGLLALPVFSVVRQSVAALVPADRRRPAYALDSMSVELSFMVGPALAVALATAASPRLTMWALGVGIVASGVCFWLLDPPTRSADEPAGPHRKIPRREWLTPRLLAVLAISLAATLVLGGTDVAVVAVLRAGGEVGWTGAVLTAWAVASLLGGFAYGAVTRSLSPLLLMAVLSLTTIPVGLGGAHWWLLCLALVPAGALCAPTLAATADAVSRLAPADVRGEAMGLHGSAVTVGIALGAPLAGAVIDASAPLWGFAVTGAIGVLVALVVLPIELGHRRRPATPTPDVDLTPAGV